MSLCAVWAALSQTQTQTQTPDPLQARGYDVTGGAAPGYVDDTVCGSCHSDLYASFQEVAMAQSFYRAQPGDDPGQVIESLDGEPFWHPKSERFYDMRLRDGRYVFRRYLEDEDGQPVNVFEQTVDWIVGSGNHSRVYLYQTPSGELFQLPLAWYSQSGRWGMAPGFDEAQHLGVSRSVRRECMFCHNALPDVAEGSDVQGAPHLFPTDLPQGIGCQRCHGPGAEHARLAMGDEIDFNRLADAIVNPADLEPQLRNDVCYQCHLQPTVELAGVRRFGQADYSYRPGQALSDYLVQMDVEAEGMERSERFEINHHPYRLEQSRCFLESADDPQSESSSQLSCLTCHDPHRKVPPSERRAHYRAACLSCHTVDACNLDTMSGASDGSTAETGDGAPLDGGDCVACHMPPRRPQDVVNVVMTDHRIGIYPAKEELIAPLEAVDSILTEVRLIEPSTVDSEAMQQIYRAVAVLQAGGGTDALDHLSRMLHQVKPAVADPYFVLARGLVKQQRFDEAAPLLRELHSKWPEYPRLPELLGITELFVSGPDAAARRLKEGLVTSSDRPELHLNLGLVRRSDGQHEDAIASFRRAIALRPTMVAAWFHLASAHDALDQLDEAVAAYRRTLEIDPDHARARQRLPKVLTLQRLTALDE